MRTERIAQRVHIKKGMKALIVALREQNVLLRAANKGLTESLDALKEAHAAETSRVLRLSPMG